MAPQPQGTCQPRGDGCPPRVGSPEAREEPVQALGGRLMTRHPSLPTEHLLGPGGAALQGGAGGPGFQELTDPSREERPHLGARQDAYLAGGGGEPAASFPRPTVSLSPAAFHAQGSKGSSDMSGATRPTLEPVTSSRGRSLLGCANLCMLRPLLLPRGFLVSPPHPPPVPRALRRPRGPHPESHAGGDGGRGDRDLPAATREAPPPNLLSRPHALTLLRSSRPHLVL